MKNNLQALAVGMIVLGLVIFSAIHLSRERSSLGSAEFNTLNAPETQTSVSVGSDRSTEVAATNTARQYLEVSNIGGGVQAAYCKWGGGAATKRSGMTLFGSTTRTFGPNENINGALNCIFNSSTSTITVIEK